MFGQRRTRAAETTVNAAQLERLARSKDADVRRGVAGNPHAPEAVLLRLAEDPNLHVRCAVARNSHATRRCLELLVHDLSVEATSVAENPMCPSDLLDDLAHRDRQKRTSRAATAKRIQDQALATWHTDTELATHALNAASLLRSHAPVSVAIAENPSTVEKTLRFLAEDHSAEVRVAVLKNPRTPHDIVRSLALDWPESKAAVAAGDPTTDIELIETLSSHPSERVRTQIVTNPSTPQALLESMAGDLSTKVRAAVAASPRTPEKLLLVLASDSESRVRSAVNDNKMASLDALVMTSQDSPSESIAEQLFWNTYLRLGGPSLKGLVRQFTVGQFRLDFALPERLIGIEIDGLAYHSDQQSFTRDRARERQLEIQGWRILRFSAKEVLDQPERCMSEASQWVLRMS